MNTTEQIAIMKYEARLANRADAEGIRNWTPEARAASLATRRANGSVWGWNKRKRAAPSTSKAFDRSMEAMTEDAETVRRALASQRAGVPTIGAPSKGAEELAAQRLEDFKAWLAELKRTDDAIADFNEIVAVMGGLTSGIAKAQRGQTIGPDYATPTAESAARKASAVEKAIRRNFEKRNADYLRENPDERGVMLDMVAEKAEYYSASPARKVEMEKDAYRQIRDSGSATMRETPAAKGPDYGTLLKVKRDYIRERDAVRPQLQPDEVAYPVGNGIWIGRLPNGDERVISAAPDNGRLYNRHTAACASSKGEECNCSCGGSQHGTQGSGSAPNGNGKSWRDYLKGGLPNLDPDYAARTVRRLEERESWGKELTADEARFVKEYDAYVEEMNKDLAKTKEPVKDPKAVKPSAPPVAPGDSPEGSQNWDKLVSGFKDMIAKGAKPTLRNLQNQLAKDHDEEKFKLAAAALAEAWHTDSLDKFQDEFERDPNNNFEFRTFQKKAGVPPEFIGGK
jgi:hypothetical protein